MMNIADLESKTREELLELAEQMNVEGYKGLKKNELIEILIRTQAEQQGFMFLSGILDIMDE
jgi:transcription termination factor Rho